MDPDNTNREDDTDDLKISTTTLPTELDQVGLPWVVHLVGSLSSTALDMVQDVVRSRTSVRPSVVLAALIQMCRRAFLLIELLRSRFAQRRVLSAPSQNEPLRCVRAANL